MLSRVSLRSRRLVSLPSRLHVRAVSARAVVAAPLCRSSFHSSARVSTTASTAAPTVGAVAAPIECDYLVIGGGIAGASTAYYLTQHKGGRVGGGSGPSVVLLEREAQPGVHSTGRSAAWYSETYGNHTVRALTSGSRASYVSPPAGFAEHRLLSPRAGLYIGTAAQTKALKTIYNDGSKLVRTLKELKRAEVLALCPVIRPEHAEDGCVYEPDAEDIDVAAVHQGFLRGVKQFGGRIVCDSDVVSIIGSGTGNGSGSTEGDGLPLNPDTAAQVAAMQHAAAIADAAAAANAPAVPAGVSHTPVTPAPAVPVNPTRAGVNGWLVRTASGALYKAGVIINAAGAWADVIGAMAGATLIGLQPKRRTIIVFKAPEQYTPAQINQWPFVMDSEEQFYFKPDAGHIWGSPADETVTEPCDAQPDDLDMAVAIDRIQTATTMQINRLSNRWAGLRSFVADKTPVVGYDPKIKNFFWVAGQGGYGIQTCFAMGEASTALALGKPMPARLTDIGLTAAELSVTRPTLLPVNKHYNGLFF